MELHNVIIRVQALRGGRPILKAEVFARPSGSGARVSKGFTSSNGTLHMQLERGVWTFDAAVPPPPENSKRGNPIPPVRGGVQVPSLKPVILHVNILNDGSDCIAVTRRLHKNLSAQKYARAQALIMRVKTSYAHYREITQLATFVELEKLLERAMMGQDINAALAQVVIPRYSWGKRAEYPTVLT
jgi:hypothetical protein